MTNPLGNLLDLIKTAEAAHADVRSTIREVLPFGCFLVVRESDEEDHYYGTIFKKGRMGHYDFRSPNQLTLEDLDQNGELGSYRFGDIDWSKTLELREGENIHDE